MHTLQDSIPLPKLNRLIPKRSKGFRLPLSSGAETTPQDNLKSLLHRSWDWQMLTRRGRSRVCSAFHWFKLPKSLNSESFELANSLNIYTEFMSLHPRVSSRRNHESPAMDLSQERYWQDKLLESGLGLGSFEPEPIFLPTAAPLGSGQWNP